MPYSTFLNLEFDVMGKKKNHQNVTHVCLFWQILMGDDGQFMLDNLTYLNISNRTLDWTRVYDYEEYSR